MILDSSQWRGGEIYSDTIEISIIHDIYAVIANEVKQSSKTKIHFLNHLDCHVGFASAALRSQLKPCCNDEAFWIPAFAGITFQFFIFPALFRMMLCCHQLWKIQ
jgi:hypothetical protein